MGIFFIFLILAPEKRYVGLFKVIEIGANRQPVFDFISVLRCNYVPAYCLSSIVPTCNDLLVENRLFFAVLPTQSHLKG